jgi:hypothetical protein
VYDGGMGKEDIIGSGIGVAIELDVSSRGNGLYRE